MKNIITDTSCATIDPVRLPLVRPTSAAESITTGGGPVEINAEYALKFLKAAASKGAAPPASTIISTANVPMSAPARAANVPMKNHVTSSKRAKAQKALPHYFSLPFAREHGVAEAIVLRFLAHKVRRAAARKSRKTFQDGKYWFFDPIRELAERYSYIPKSTMADILKRLKAKKLIEVGNYNKRDFDRTGWYSVPQEVMDAAEKGPLIRVDQDVARRLGIPAGVLMAHFRFKLLKKHRGKQRPHVSISPAALAELLPFSSKTIKRTLDKLLEKGLIVKHPDSGLLFTLPELLSVAGTDPDRQWTDPDKEWTNPDEKWTDPDNNTHYKPLETIGRPFKENTPASPAVVGERSDDRNQEAITYDQLKDINNNNSHVFEFKNPKLGQWDQPADDPGMVAVNMVTKFSYGFLHSLSDDALFDLHEITDMDRLVAAVNTLLSPYFESEFSAQSTNSKYLKHVFFHASLEFIINAIAAQRADSFTYYFHSIENLSGCIFTNLKQHIFERLDADNTRSWQRWMEDRKKQFASVDERKESDASLTPAEKARVLRNALQSRQQVGYLDHMCNHKEMPIIFSNADLDKAERLFELNREFSVAQLLRVMDRCVYIHVNDVRPEGFDERFHARRGHKLGYFLKHIIKIAEELEITDLNGWEPLPEDLKHNEDESTELAAG